MKLDRAFLVIVAIAIVARLIFVFAFPETGGDWDVYGAVAQNILRGCGVSLSDPSGAECVPHFGGNHLPGYPAFVALAWVLSGHSDMAIRVAQVLLHGLALLRLMSIVEHWTACRPIATAVGLVMALSPLDVAWPRYMQTETLALATAIWFFAEIVASIDQGRLRAIPLGLAIVAATFIRLDGVFLCVPVAVAAFYLHRPVEAIRRGTIAAAVVALSFAAWTARNIAVGLPGLLPIGMVIPNGAPTPYGYLKWGSTWITEEYQRMGWAWPVNHMSYGSIAIDNKAFDSAEEKTRVMGLLTELKRSEGKPFPTELDAQFAELARERASRAPVRTYLLLPAMRALALFENPFSSFGWPNEMIGGSIGDQGRLEASRSPSRLFDLALAYPDRAASKALNGVYRYLLFASMLFVMGLALVGRLPRSAPLIWIVVTWVAARTLFLAVTNNVETRYTAPTVPPLELSVVLGLSEFLARRRKAGVIAPSSF
jgi:hypothetical protein